MGKGYCNGRSYIETGSSNPGEYTTAIDYLTDDGRRHRVFVDSSHDSQKLREAIGIALANGRRGQVK